MCNHSLGTLTPDDITTINYTLSWPYLENPSNTTFAGPTQIDICRCPRSDISSQKNEDPGHIYTRYKCASPDIHFNIPEDGLWILEAPLGPINMLRPATEAERQRRQELYDDDNPNRNADRKLILLTGPCPRGRYQAYATERFLKSLSAPARNHISCLSLLIQPYEEDCIDGNSRQAFTELAEYVLRHLPNFKTLYLHIWEDRCGVRSSASEFSVLLSQDDVKICVGWKRLKSDLEEYRDVKSFLKAVNADHGEETTSTKYRSYTERRSASEESVNSPRSPQYEDLEEGGVLVLQRDHEDTDASDEFTDVLEVLKMNTTVKGRDASTGASDRPDVDTAEEEWIQL